MERKINLDQLTSKDKRYIQQVEKVLLSFDSVAEWADYISFLARLQKSLQLREESSGVAKNSIPWIPFSEKVANRLSLCLSPNLPNGVHQKALSIYELIFNSLNIDTFNEELPIWISGLFPLLSYCSIQVKPQFLKILKESLTKVHLQNLKLMTRPLILSLLAGLDDENSEIFNDVISLMDFVKLKLQDDSNFWQSFFLCIISNPERRLGGLFWCNKRLPVFRGFTENEGDESYSSEVEACLSPESGLLIRAFASSISSSNDIIVVRGFFDLLLSHLPLNSEIFKYRISASDKELLIMSSCRVTLKKDMSLNRRLWNFFLGPDTEIESSTTRSEYFEKYALETVSIGLLKLANNDDFKVKIEAFKMSLSIIMDVWEISNLITPKLFTPFLEICHKNKENKELLFSAQLFFDGVESGYIWNDVINILLEEEDKSSLDFLEFILKTFNFNEEEMITIHAPLAVICLLSTESITTKKINILEILLGLIPQSVYFQDSATNGNIKDINGNDNTEDNISKIKTYYIKSIANEHIEPPFQKNEIPLLIINLSKDIFIGNINTKNAYKLCTILCHLLDTIKDYSSPDLTQAILNLPRSSPPLLALGITKIFNYTAKNLTEIEKLKMLKLILTNLWPSIHNSDTLNYQVEAVKAIYDLQSSCLNHSIEAGILELLLNLPRQKKIRAITTLWIHSSSFNGDAILVRPLQVLLDDLTTNSQDSMGLVNFIQSVVKNGSSNRLLKLITNPLLDFDFLNAEREELIQDDDLGQFSYFLNAIDCIIKTNFKPIKEAFNNELAVMVSSTNLKLIKGNNWDISTYKSLCSSVIFRFFQLKLNKELLEDESALDEHFNCVNNALKLLTFLVTGNEPDFLERFHTLIHVCSYYTNLEPSYTIELIESKFLLAIFHFLEISEELKINLNLLHVEDDEKVPLLINFIIQGITKAETSLLLEGWLKLLIRSLYLFNDEVFSVLLNMNDCIISKIEYFFTKISNFGTFHELEHIESSINALVSGLEDLSSITHSYLLTSNLKFNNERAKESSDGFFGNVIQGVFQIESPAVRNSEQNKLYTILLSFQDAVAVCFKIWQWADSKPAPIDGIGERSLTYLAHKLKFKARKMMECLIDLEKQEVIESLIYVGEVATRSILEVPTGKGDLTPKFVPGDITTNIKLLNILDGGRSQITLPHLFNSIRTRCFPQIMEELKKSSLNIPISEREISSFLVVYFDSVDSDTITDVWNITIQFLKDILAHSVPFKAVLPDSLKLLKTLSFKLSPKLREYKKNKKEISDLFVKLLNVTVSGKQDNDDESLENSTNSLEPVDHILDALVSVIEHFDTIIQDSDKVSVALNSITSNLITPQIKLKKIEEIPLKTLILLDLIGKNSANKTWKTLVFDTFMDSSFFHVNLNQLWERIISTWISLERDRIQDFVARITTQSTPTNIFNWNEGNEVENKIQSLKRISYLLLIQPKDYFIANLEEIFSKVEESLALLSPIYRSELSTLLRAVTLQFSEIHLIPHWTIITHELLSIFEFVYSSKSQSKEELKLILNGCKLLDQLLILRYDEFNLSEWLFVSSSPDIINGSQDSTIAIIDRIAKLDFTYLKDLPVKVEQPLGLLVPLIRVGSIKNLTELRLFFDHLSLINYERTFGMYGINWKVCESAVMDDL